MGSFVPDFICSLLFGRLIQLIIRRRRLNSAVILLINSMYCELCFLTPMAPSR
jgi:hypothetical protein